MEHLKGHDNSPDCWCAPDCYTTSTGFTVVHNDSAKPPEDTDGQ